MICLVRHTRVDVPQGICYGQTDVRLADTFMEEAVKVKAQLEDLSFDKVFSSPLWRCVALANYCGYSNAIQSDALLELDFGVWENQAWDHLDMRIWETDWVHNPPPQGESFINMYKRVSRFLSALPQQNILIFTHKGVINCAKAYFKGIPLQAAFDEPLEYGRVEVFTRPNR